MTVDIGGASPAFCLPRPLYPTHPEGWAEVGQRTTVSGEMVVVSGRCTCGCGVVMGLALRCVVLRCALGCVHCTQAHTPAHAHAPARPHTPAYTEALIHWHHPLRVSPPSLTWTSRPPLPPAAPLPPSCALALREILRLLSVPRQQLQRPRLAGLGTVPSVPFAGVPITVTGGPEQWHRQLLRRYWGGSAGG